MSNEKKEAIWAILAKHCGAGDEVPQEFLIHYPRCREFRFMGSLGFGGKVWCNRGNDPLIYVTCYPEDETPERAVAIHAANQELAALKPEVAS